jgi:hypothetical protein
MELVDNNWDDIEAFFINEGLLSADCTFSTKSNLTHTVDYLSKNHARNLDTNYKEQLDLLKYLFVATPIIKLIVKTTTEIAEEVEAIEKTPTTEVMLSAGIMPTPNELTQRYGNRITKQTSTRKRIDAIITILIFRKITEL